MLHVGINHAHHITTGTVFWQPLAVVDAEDAHALVVVQIGEELGRDEEVLATVRLAGDLDERVMHSALGTLVHTLLQNNENMEYR